MKLLLVRHAESMGNATGNFSTSISDSLSPQGEAQAVVLSECLQNMTVDRIIVSPRLRTRQTITPYLEATGRQAEIWPEVAEACWHDERQASAENWPAEELTLHDSELSLFTFRNNEAIHPAHPETFGEGLARVHAALAMINGIAMQSDESLLMVTHGHYLRELLNLMLKTSEMEPFHHGNCAMTQVSFNGEWTLDFTNRAP